MCSRDVTFYSLYVHCHLDHWDAHLRHMRPPSCPANGCPLARRDRLLTPLDCYPGAGDYPLLRHLAFLRRTHCSSCTCARSHPEGERPLARVLSCAQRDRALDVRDRTLPTPHCSLPSLDNPLAPGFLSPPLLVCSPPAGERTLPRHVLPLASLERALDAHDHPPRRHGASPRVGEITLGVSVLPHAQLPRSRTSDERTLAQRLLHPALVPSYPYGRHSSMPLGPRRPAGPARPFVSLSTLLSISSHRWTPPPSPIRALSSLCRETAQTG